MSKRELDFENAAQGAVVEPSPSKTRITIRLDTDTLAWFRSRAHEAGGGSYQTLINEALREYVRNRGGELEKLLRRVIREELETKYK